MHVECVCKPCVCILELFFINVATCRHSETHGTCTLYKFIVPVLLCVDDDYDHANDFAMSKTCMHAIFT